MRYFPTRPADLAPDFHLKTVITRGEQHFVVSTCFTMDCGLETMVFAAHPDGSVTDFRDLACDRYQTEAEARAGHAALCEGFVVPPPELEDAA